MSSLSFFILSAALLTVQNSLNGPLSRPVNVDENGFLTERISFVASSFQSLFALAPANFGWAVTSKLQLLCSKIWAFIYSDKYTQVALGPPTHQRLYSWKQICLSFPAQTCNLLNVGATMLPKRVLNWVQNAPEMELPKCTGVFY